MNPREDTPVSTEPPLTVRRLHVQNVKRIREVEIEPDGTVVKIAGRNGQGKTSLIDALYLLLANRSAGKLNPHPLRDGEDHAEVEADLGEYTVRRTWKRGEPGEDGTRPVRSTLTVTNAEGHRFQGPQEILDKLLAPLSFDPGQFVRMGVKDQVKLLLSLANPEFDPVAQEDRRRALYAERLVVGRDVRRVRAQLDGVPEVDEIPEPRSAAEATAAYAAARDIVEQNTRKRTELAAGRATVDRLADRVTEAARVLAAAKTEYGNAVLQVEAQQSVVDQLVDPDVSGFQAQVEEIEAHNTEIAQLRDQAETRARLVNQLELYEATHAEAENGLREIDEARAAAVAKANLPVPGLGLTDEGITVDGIPFVQASGAQQIRLSMAMAMALHPEPGIGVIRITDGALLDDESMAVVEQMAADAGVQVWVELVSEGEPEDHAIVIEDGVVL